MIDEYWTFIFYGYHSDELKPYSAKPIVARCETCCRYRVLVMGQYRDFCMSCARKLQKRKPLTEEHKHNISIGSKGRKMPPLTDEARRNRSKAQKGKKKPPRTHEHLCRISAGHQGIPYEEWTGFVSNGEYCEKFDDACRERIREKYDRMCYVCGKDEKENGRKLDVHHVDMNKKQGCDGAHWKLVPLCKSCHAQSHGNPLKSRIMFIVDQNV